MENKNILKIDVLSNFPNVWFPLALVRWKRYEVNEITYKNVLQQLWKCTDGKQEWRDVPEED